MIAWIRYHLALCRWVISHPNSAKLVLSGVDPVSRQLIYRRWSEKEPKREDFQ